MSTRRSKQRLRVSITCPLENRQGISSPGSDSPRTAVATRSTKQGNFPIVHGKRNVAWSRYERVPVPVNGIRMERKVNVRRVPRSPTVRHRSIWQRRLLPILPQIRAFRLQGLWSSVVLRGLQIQRCRLGRVFHVLLFRSSVPRGDASPGRSMLQQLWQSLGSRLSKP